MIAIQALKDKPAAFRRFTRMNLAQFPRLRVAQLAAGLSLDCLTESGHSFRLRSMLMITAKV